MATTLRAKESFSYDLKGVPVTVAEGSLRPSNHPDVKGRESLFEPVEQVAERHMGGGTYSAQVEQATAQPGQRRDLSRS